MQRTSKREIKTDRWDIVSITNVYYCNSKNPQLALHHVNLQLSANTILVSKQSKRCVTIVACKNLRMILFLPAYRPNATSIKNPTNLLNIIFEPISTYYFPYVHTLIYTHTHIYIAKKYQIHAFVRGRTCWQIDFSKERTQK